MTAYATAADLAARWRTLSPDEEPIATTLLEDAAAIIDSVVDASTAGWSDSALAMTYEVPRESDEETDSQLADMLRAA